MPRRAIQRSRTITPPPPPPETRHIYWWEQASSRGIAVKYTVLLHRDGTLSCDCPGWTFYSKRSCKHTKAKEGDAPRILSLHREGRPLPVMRDAAGRMVAGPVETESAAAEPVYEETPAPTPRKKKKAKAAPTRARKNNNDDDDDSGGFNRIVEV